MRKVDSKQPEMRKLMPVLCNIFFLIFGSHFGRVSSGMLDSEANGTECQVYGNTLQCDFKFTRKDVRVDQSINKYKTVLVTNANKLLLYSGVCTSVNLYHISSAIYISSSNSQDTGDCEARALHLHNVTIDHIPPYLHTLSMENSRLTGTFMHQPFLKKVKVVSSYINQLHIDSRVQRNGEVRLHNTNISSLSRLEMSGNSKLFLTDSVVYECDPLSLILYHNSSAEIMRTSFLHRQDTTIISQQEGDGKIIMANITGLFSLSYKQADSEQEQASPCTSLEMKTSKLISIILLSLLSSASIIVNICLVWCLIKHKDHGRETRNRLEKNKIDTDDDVTHQTKFVLLKDKDPL